MPRLTEHTQTPESLKEIAEWLTDQAALLHAIARQMDDKGVQELKYGGANILEKSLDYLESFAGLTRKALLAAVRDRGDFAASKPRPERTPGAKAAAKKGPRK